MADYFLGEIRIVAFDYAIKDWDSCDGQMLQVTSNEALFSLIRNTFGGNGATTFALPDFRGRVPIATGDTYEMGYTGGLETVSLSFSQIPPHNHRLIATSPSVLDLSTLTENPTGAMLTNSGNVVFSNTFDTEELTNLKQSLAVTGTNTGHNNIQPSLGLNFLISTTGYYPPRN